MWYSSTLTCSGSRRWLGLVIVACMLSTGAAGQAAENVGLSEAEALLQAGQAADAVVRFKQILAAQPDSIDAHLGLGRAYYALGDYARAVIEFETVLKFDNLPPELHGQAEIYDQAAIGFAAGQRWRRFHYWEAGIGNYRENSSSATDLFGGAGDRDTFLPLRIGGGLNGNLTERDTFNGTLDYRFRAYDDRDRRNDSDLRWNFNAGRTLDDDHLRYGVRGRVSYRGNGQYRNDWGAYADYRFGLGGSDQVHFVGELSERRYPSGPLRSRTRDIASLTGSWTHALADGRTSVTLAGQLTQEWATQGRPDGDGTFWGLRGEVDHSFSTTLDGFLRASYVNEAYDDERPDFSGDSDLLRVRNDDLWNFGGGVVWRLREGWTLRPTFEYNWETSNIDALAYSSTELWLTVRKAF